MHNLIPANCWLLCFTEGYPHTGAAKHSIAITYRHCFERRLLSSSLSFQEPLGLYTYAELPRM
jgi:hypothetical protein